MKIIRQNRFVAALFSIIFTLCFSQPSYAEIGYTTLSIGVAGTAAAGVLATFFSKNSSRNRSEPIEITTNAEEIPEQIEIGTPYPLKIQANKSDYNGRVYLSSTGAIEPNYATLVNGVWDGYIKFNEVGKNHTIKLRWDNVDGTTSTTTINGTYNITDPNKNKSDHTTLLTGKITDSHGNPVEGATINIFNGNPSEGEHETHTVTDGNGDYKFHNTYPGSYYLKIEKHGYQPSIKESHIASGRIITTNATLPCACNAKGKTPVLLIPGIMGSYSKEKAPFLWPYPHLSPFSPTWDSGELEMLDPFGQIGWGKVTKALQHHGYTKDCTIFNVPYDWSLSIPSIRDKYLKPWIDQAKKISGSDKVDIISHSMGGLVTRSYAQSDLYENDIRKFAMVGTPNKGAEAVYYIWEAGDPIAADIVSGNTGITNPTAYFYTNTLNNFYYDKYWTNVCQFGEIRRYDPSYCDKNKIYDLAHSNAISSGQLMPTYDDALLDSISFINIPIAEEENTFLKALNNLPCFNPMGCIDENGKIHSYKSPQNIFTSNSSKVQTKLFIGIEKDTVASIHVTPKTSDLFYKDGIPKNATQASGDGTVLPKSVNINDYLSPNNPLEFIQKPSEHSALIGAFSNELIQFIAEDSYSPKAMETAHKASAPQKTLVISINGRVQAKINSVLTPNNIIKTEDSLKLEKNFKIDSSSLMIENPENGKYSIALKSPYHESYELSVSYYDGTTNKLYSQKYIGYFDSKSKEFAFTINAQALDTPLSFDRNFNTPTHLKISNVASKIKLAWQDTTSANNNDIDHYEIYWRVDSAPYMQLLSITKDKSHLTNHDWKDAASHAYAVRSVLKDGKGTFLSQPSFSITE